MRLFLFLLSILFFTDFYDLSLGSYDGSTIHLSAYKGKKVLIVNVASRSYYASQLQHLDTLGKMFGDQLVIIAVPSNSFGKEPMDSAAIARLQKEGHFHFIMAEK